MKKKRERQPKGGGREGAWQSTGMRARKRGTTTKDAPVGPPREPLERDGNVPSKGGPNSHGGLVGAIDQQRHITTTRKKANDAHLNQTKRLHMNIKKRDRTNKKKKEKGNNTTPLCCCCCCSCFCFAVCLCACDHAATMGRQGLTYELRSRRDWIQPGLARH